MTTLITRTGRRFDLAHPTPSMVCIEDVSWHLSCINRYNGATLRPLSVAEHALLVTEIIEREVPGVLPMVLRAALHHDSAEAYTGDATSPAKCALAALGIDWERFAGPVDHAVQSHFGTSRAAQDFKLLIKHADLVARATEVRDLRTELADEHPELASSVPVDWIDLRSRDGMDWMDWRRAFADRHAELAAACEAWAAQGTLLDPDDDSLPWRLPDQV